MATDPRFLADSGREIFTGNELLIKGALETDGGVHLLTGYPGSPVAGFFDLMGDLSDLLKAKGIRAFQANNEALGAAALNGSQMAACRGIVAFKSVGTHVAADALALGTWPGPTPTAGRSSSAARTRGATARRSRPTAGSCSSTCGCRSSNRAQPAVEGLDQPQLQAEPGRPGCSSATSSPSPTPTAAAPSTAGRTSGRR